MSTKERDAKIDTLIASFLVYNKEFEDQVFRPRFKQRLGVTDAWAIEKSSRVLDIGCGQGESALTIALELGPAGHVTAIDTSPPDYGTPHTVEQSHAYISKSPLGSMIDFRLTSASSFLNTTTTPKFDAATLCHSAWYFPTPDALAALFPTLASAAIPTIYIAEYNLQSVSMPSQIPHQVAALAQAMYHRYVAAVSELLPLNIRVAPNIDTITEAAGAAGYHVARSGIITPDLDYHEGKFETEYVAGDRFTARVKEKSLPVEQEAEILARAADTKRAVDDLARNGGGPLRSMDVWWAEFRRKM
ncbi:hypothetical protein B0T17DRAFT_541429 [Bombardia bombarda]|uniref:Methyltransferase domain-containing protein n=1 Tax=Bombardia bombarda TaxID=252184 RepID=A0AA39WGZ8_9PEZI|nr:hypothetical protein B0T17DRAFT_541429 [Bombardia bombarda]